MVVIVYERGGVIPKGENMFVARYSLNPEYDVQRRWSAYMEPTSARKEGLAELLIELGVAKLPPRLDEAIRRNLQELGYHPDAIKR
jgi:hypothetical protein